MAFLKIEPSTDIHLVLDPNFKDSLNNPLNDLLLKIWRLSHTTIFGNRGFSFTDIAASCDFDFYPIGQNFVSIAGTTLSPQNKKPL